MADDLASIAPSGANTWVAQTTRPDTNAYITLTDLAVPQGVVLVFVGGRPLPGATLAAASFVTPSFRATGTTEWKALVESRGQAGVLLAVPTDTSLWGGSVGFDSEQSWYFGADPDGHAEDEADFQGVALHELTHLFGFADSNPAFRRHVSGYTFTGPDAVAEYGGPVPTEESSLVDAQTGAFIRSAPSHWSQEVLSRGHASSMVPAVTNGDRAGLSPLDTSALRDIGWELPAPPPAPPPPAPPVVVPPTPPPVVVLPVAPPPVAPPTPAVTPRAVRLGSPQFAVTGGASVSLRDPDQSVRLGVAPFPGLAGQVRTAVADFTSDGVGDLLAGTGPGAASRVRLLDGATGAELFAFAPFEAGFTGGVYVAAADVTGDGVADVIVTPDEGGGPRVRVFSGAGFGQVADFFGIDDPDFRGGARPAGGDLNGDGVADLLISAGFGGGPRLAAFDGRSLGGTPTRLFADFFAFEPDLRNGAFVALGDLDGDGDADVIAGGGPGGGPRVTVFGGRGLLGGGPPAALANFFAGDTAGRGGVRVAAKDLDGDDRADLVTGAGPGGGSRVTAYRGGAVPPGGTPPELFAFDALPGSLGGAFVG